MGARGALSVVLWLPQCCGVCVSKIWLCREDVSIPLGICFPKGAGGSREDPVEQCYVENEHLFLGDAARKYLVGVFVP